MPASASSRTEPWSCRRTATAWVCRCVNGGRTSILGWSSTISVLNTDNWIPLHRAPQCSSQDSRSSAALALSCIGLAKACEIRGATEQHTEALHS